jgi:hypothetical protein
MFGIKTAIKNYLTYRKPKKISNDWHIFQLMKYFQADEHGHRANTQKADLGYAWLHYGFIRQQKPKNLLCIGSRHGFIPAIMAQACKDNDFGKVDFVDAGFGNEQPTKNWSGVGFWKKINPDIYFAKMHLQNHITAHIMTTREYAKQNPKKHYQYIYIDGDHSYEGVKLDYKLFWPKLDFSCFMVFHDVMAQGFLDKGVFGVRKFFKEISQKNAIIFPLPKHSGLGIIQKIKND